MPPEVLERARGVLERLEGGRFARSNRGSASAEPQLTLFEPVGNEMLEELRELDPAGITPLDALALLTRWKEEHGSGPS